jgi:hypothetical protein
LLNNGTECQTTDILPGNVPIDEDTDNTNIPIRLGRKGIVYDELGNPWDAIEYERKQKNPYRWFIETQRKKQKAKGPSQDEQAASAMVSRYDFHS